MLTIIVSYLALGAFAGVLAGLLGIGGGLVIVPALTFMFTGFGFPDAHILHMALGTSLASIIFTSVSSVRAHHKRGAVNWDALKSITPGIILGTFGGTWVAAALSTNALKIVFVVFLYYVSYQMLRGGKPKPSRHLPGAAGMFGAGGVIGVFSSLVGIGGGTLSVPFLVFCNQAIHTAVGTAAAIGLPIALAGAAGYAINGMGIEGLPGPHIGFIYIPALMGVVCASVFTAPLGAKLAHSLPVAKLKKVFALLLILTASRMLWSLF